MSFLKDIFNVFLRLYSQIENNQVKFFSQMIKEGKVTCYLQRSFYISCFLLLDTIFETLYTESPFFIYNTQKVCHMSDNSPTFHLYFNGTFRAQFHSTLNFCSFLPLCYALFSSFKLPGNQHFSFLSVFSNH